MPNKNLKFSAILIITIVLVLGASISLQSLLAAWTAPTADPPGDNTNSPIYNAGTVDLPIVDKPLTINDNFYIGADNFFVNNTSGDVGIGTVNPSEKLEVDGNIKINNEIIFTGGGYIRDEGSQLIIGHN